MIAELRRQHMREQTWAGKPPFDRAGGRGRLHDPVVSRTAEPGAHMADDLEAGWQVLQHLGDILAQRLQHAAAGGTVLLGGMMGMDFTRQMLGQWPALVRHGSAIRDRISALRCGCGLGVVRFELFQLQFQLLDLTLDLLRTSSKLHPLQLGDQQLQMFNLVEVGEQRGVLQVDHGLQGRGIETVEIGQPRAFLHGSTIAQREVHNEHQTPINTGGSGASRTGKDHRHRTRAA